jgi:hypothetical protein
VLLKALALGTAWRWPSHTPSEFLTYRCRSRSRPGPRWQRGGDQARLEIVISYQPQVFDGML